MSALHKELMLLAHRVMPPRLEIPRKWSLKHRAATSRLTGPYTMGTRVRLQWYRNNG